jgi:hypothetical protein
VTQCIAPLHRQGAATTRSALLLNSHYFALFTSLVTCHFSQNGRPCIVRAGRESKRKVIMATTAPVTATTPQ